MAKATGLLKKLLDLCSWNRYESRDNRYDSKTWKKDDEETLLAKVAQVLAEVKKLSAEEANKVVNGSATDGRTPLMQACKAAFSAPLVRMLLEAGAQPDWIPVPPPGTAAQLELTWDFYNKTALHVAAIWPRCVDPGDFPNEEYGRVSRETEDTLLEITIALTGKLADKGSLVDKQISCTPYVASDSMLEGSAMTGWLHKKPTIKESMQHESDNTMSNFTSLFLSGPAHWSKRYATLEVTPDGQRTLKYRRHKHSTVYSVITNVLLVDHHKGHEQNAAGGPLRRFSVHAGKTLRGLKKARVSTVSTDTGSPAPTIEADGPEGDLSSQEIDAFNKTNLFAVTGTFKTQSVSYLFSCPSQMEMLKWKRKLGGSHGGELINVTPLMLAILSGRTLVANYLIKMSDIQIKDSKKKNATLWAVEHGRTVVAETAAEEWLRQMQQIPFEFHKRKLDVNVETNPLFQDLAMRIRDFGWDAPFVKSGMLLALMLCDTRNPMHTANQFAIMCDGNSGDGLTLIWEMMAEQARAVAAGLVGQIPDMAKVALLLRRQIYLRYDISEIVQLADGNPGSNSNKAAESQRERRVQLMALGYQATNMMMFAQPMVQSYYQERWRNGDDNTHVDQKSTIITSSGEEGKLSVWLARLEPAFLRTPRASFWISTLFYVAFLVLLSIVAQEEANVVPQISEATRTIILYAFAWGHVADELMQIIEVKRETKSHAAYFSDSGNYVDLIRCALFILTFVLRGYAWLFRVSRFSLAFRAANIIFALFIIFCFIHLLSRTVAMNRTIGLQYIMTMRLLGDLMSFIVMLAAMVISFALAIHKVFIDGAQSDGASLESAGSVGSLTSALVNLIFSTFGMFDQKELHTEFSNDFLYSWTSLAMTFFLVVYLIVTAILLMNLLIAAFNDTYMKLNEEAESQLKFAFSRITMEYSSGTVLPSPLNLIHYLFLAIYNCVMAVARCFCFCRKPEKEIVSAPASPKKKDRNSKYELTTSTDTVTVQYTELEETEEFMLKVTATCILGYLRAYFTTNDTEENHAEVVESLKAIARTVESQK